MENITPKEKILKKIRAGLLYKTPNKYPGIDLDSSVYEDMAAPLPEVFAKSLTEAGGKFLYCHNHFDFIDSLLDLQESKKSKNLYCWDKKLQAELDEVGIAFTADRQPMPDMETAITTCECLVARTGTVVTSSLKNSRTLIAAPRLHIVVAYMNQLVPDIKDSFKYLKNHYGNRLPAALTYITGPSRTADIERRLVTGVHGPHELYVFLINDKK